MKRVSHWLVASTFGIIIFLGEFGCVGEPFQAAEASESEVSEDVAAENDDKNLKAPEISWNPGKEIDISAAKHHVPSSKQPPHAFKEPNSIIIETCEPDPDEVAVPLNVEDDKECHKVHASAIHADANGITYMDVNFTWSIEDTSIVKIIGDESAKHGSSINLQANYDIFSYDNLTGEPKTTLKVCVAPKAGWKDNSHPALCRSLPVYAVANMQGSWCFKGDYFASDPGADCQSLTIEQDGRFLTIETHDHGTIYEKQLDFYYDNLEYRSTESSYTTMSGIILAGNDVEGSFSAFRLPL
jgi:hypothetical protein